MKKILILFLALAAAAVHHALAMGLMQSKHDMNSISKLPETRQLCVFCHHPHIASSNLINQHMLWDDGISNYTYNISYSYDSMPANNIGIPTGQKAADDPPNPAMGSMYCLGCHDGDTGPNITSHFNEHPFNFSVGQVVNLGIVTPFRSLIPIGNDPAGDQMYIGNGPGFNGLANFFIGALYNTDTYPLFSGTLQCATCHNPHNGNNYGSGVQFLRNSGNKNPLFESIICRNCHTDK